jgi:hypothetical protein
MFHGRGFSARCFLEVAVGSVERSERATRSAAGRRRSADAELWRPCEPDVVMGPGTKSGRCVYFPLRLGVRIECGPAGAGPYRSRLGVSFF